MSLKRKRNRFNYGSYRNNSYYKNREFNKYYTNNFTSSNYYPYKRWSNWDKNNTNSNYSWGNSNHRSSSGNYRNNYKYSEREQESPSFAEDSFQYKSFNNDEKETQEDQLTNSATETAAAINTKTHSNCKDNIRSINNKFSRQSNRAYIIRTKRREQLLNKTKTPEKYTEIVLDSDEEELNNESIDNVKENESATLKALEKANVNVTTLNVIEPITTITPAATELYQSNKRVYENSQERTTVLDKTPPTTNLFQKEETAVTSASPQPSNSNQNTSATSESEHFEFHTPKISLIPLSRLLAAESWETNYNESSLLGENSRKSPNTPQKTIYKPNLIKRKRNVSTCSNSSTGSQTNSATDRIVEKLVTKNKINIKNIINSTETKYDEALKTQARKRLREEIRRQLKSMNIEPPRDPINSDFVPDEIVDSIDIPDVVIDEIRKALGLELFPFDKDEQLNLVLGNNSSETLANTMPLTAEKNVVNFLTAVEAPMEQNNVSASTLEVEELLQQRSISSAIKPVTIDSLVSATSDLKKECKTNEIRTKSKKLSKRKESHKSHKKQRSYKKSKDDDVIRIYSSSSESSSSSPSSSSSSSTSSSSSSSDSESDTSEKSSASVAKRKRLKLKVDAENVVDSFEKLILSSLSESLKERYRSKYSTSINTKLHFISCICTSDYNSGKFSKLQIAKVQKNLKSSDCSMALEFLMKEIVNVFNKQKQVAKMENGSKSSKKSDNTPKKDYEQATEEKSSYITTKTPLLTTTPNGLKTKSVNNAEKVQLNAVAATTNSENHIQQCVSKVLSLYRQEMKAAMQANETKTTNSPSASQNTKETAENQTKSSTKLSLSAAANNEDKNAGHAKHNEETHLKNPINCLNQQLQKQHQTTQQQSITSQRDNELNQQTPTTQDYLAKLQQCNNNTVKEKVPTQIIPIHSLCSSNFNSNLTTTLNGNLSVLGLSSAAFNQQHSFPIVDLEELKKQSPVGGVVVNNLREIDVKLMELHKRKMYLEEMILKLQKDKMEADLLTIKLQNEKFILLNTAMTANVTTSALKNSNIENIKLSSKEVEKINTLKTETTIINDVIIIDDDKPKEEAPKEDLEDQEQEQHQPESKNSTNDRPPPTASKNLVTTRRNSTTAEKRKISDSNTTNDIPKKRTKSNKTTAATKPPSKKPNTRNSSKINASNKAAESKTENSSKETESETLKSPKENTTKKSKDSKEESNTPPPQAPPTTPISLPDPSATPETQPPSTLPLSEKSPETQLELAKSSATKSLYKNMPTGSFEGIRNPITQVRLFEEFIVASSEDGKLYKFDANTLKLLVQFAKHTEAITQMYLCPQKRVIYTTSLDGYLKKSSFENFALDVKSIYLQEPLQSIDLQWDITYIGSRWGNIYTYNVETNSVSEKPLCATDSSIISIKATKEGARKILIVSSKGNLLQLRDATSGLLLRTFDVPESINIYSILLNEGIIYCGTQKKEIRRYDFVSGEYLGVMTCGNGAVSMQIYNNEYIFVGCYDGYIYIIDTKTSKQVGRIAGSGKMILTLEIIEDKIITSAKDNSMKVLNVPSYCLKNNKST